MLGLAVANVAGVPAATWLGQHARLALGVLAGRRAGGAHRRAGRWLVPPCPGNPEATRAQRARGVQAAGLLTLLAGAIGFGGMFAMYTYIAPTVTDVAGLPESAVPLFLLAFGLGHGRRYTARRRLADWSVFRSLLVGSLGHGRRAAAPSALAGACTAGGALPVAS